MDLEWIWANANDVKDIIAKVFSKKNQERFADIQEAGNEIIDLVFAILREPLAVKGIDLQRSRGFVDAEMLEEVVRQIEKRQHIIAYESQEDME